MFGISFTELVLILVVALVVLGPERLPGMLRTVGLWIHRVRQMTTEVRAQTGIDDLLRQEGFSGGLNELRALLRGDPSALLRAQQISDSPNLEADPYRVDSNLEVDTSRERPVEGPDSYGALADDLVDEPALSQSETSSSATTADARSSSSESRSAAPSTLQNPPAAAPASGPAHDDVSPTDNS